MSEFTICNYCFLEEIKLEAEKIGSTVYLRPPGFERGTDIFVVPAGEKMPEKEDMIQPCDEYPNGNEAYSKYHRAWLMDIPNHCSCYKGRGMTKGKKYKLIFKDGSVRTGDYELTTLAHELCFFMDETDKYEYFKDSELEAIVDSADEIEEEAN